MTIAITRAPARSIINCELTFLERQPVDFDLARGQHQAYCTALSDCGARVITLPALEEFPDSVFVEDNAIIFDAVAVLVPMGVASRKGEMQHIKQEIARYRAIKRVEPPAQIEGGDVLRVGKTVFVGQSTRTNEEGAHALAKIIAPYGYDVRSIAVTGCLHLKTAATALDERTIIANVNWIDTAPLKNFEIISVPRDEQWAGNVLRVNDFVLVNARCPQTVGMLRARNDRVRAMDIGEFMKAEAGLTCMSLMFENS